MAAADSLQAALKACETRHRKLDGENQKLVELTAQLEATNKRLEGELVQTRSTLEYVERQFISLEQGLQSYETKASAVAALAEARLAYDKLLRETPSAEARPEVREALGKIQKSDEMILLERYAASVYFAKRALRLLDESAEGNDVRVVTVTEANVRRGPGLDYDVVAQISLGTKLVELEYRAPWYRVSTPGGISGWVHESVTALRR